ncbi:unnamed protein product [Ranitomeya imitator]|uniref:Uncharacterized protein n=1 Tax=Ranitomeya imitator TaxID=111125 RepID=A0ABN9LIC0_9NEOB|nr:unnamed protein product [Ranitomeya imitator]
MQIITFMTNVNLPCFQRVFTLQLMILRQSCEIWVLVTEQSLLVRVPGQYCKNKGPDWLDTLRLAPYEEAKSALCALPGVGAKVADCVCLMALDKPEAVPVDTHVWQIAKRGTIYPSSVRVTRLSQSGCTGRLV